MTRPRSCLLTGRSTAQNRPPERHERRRRWARRRNPPITPPRTVSRAGTTLQNPAEPALAARDSLNGTITSLRTLYCRPTRSRGITPHAPGVSPTRGDGFLETRLQPRGHGQQRQPRIRARRRERDQQRRQQALRSRTKEARSELKTAGVDGPERRTAATTCGWCSGPITRAAGDRSPSGAQPPADIEPGNRRELRLPVGPQSRWLKDGSRFASPRTHATRLAEAAHRVRGPAERRSGLRPRPPRPRTRTGARAACLPTSRPQHGSTHRVLNPVSSNSPVPGGGCRSTGRPPTAGGRGPGERDWRFAEASSPTVADMADPQPLPGQVAGDALLLTPEEAARVLRVGRTTIYGLIKSGELRPVHIGRTCRLARAELEHYVDRLQAPPPRPPARRRRRGSRTTTNQSGLFDVVHTPAHAEWPVDFPRCAALCPATLVVP
jgi:excisionase family DNA binding protein